MLIDEAEIALPSAYSAEGHSLVRDTATSEPCLINAEMISKNSSTEA
jgi:hypothetical protein